VHLRPGQGGTGSPLPKCDAAPSNRGRFCSQATAEASRWSKAYERDQCCASLTVFEGNGGVDAQAGNRFHSLSVDGFRWLECGGDAIGAAAAELLASGERRLRWPWPLPNGTILGLRSRRLLVQTLRRCLPAVLAALAPLAPLALALLGDP
jgi:hypothetical protein